MKTFTYKITDPDGLHARPAGLLVKQAAQYASSIKIDKGGSKTADAKKIFSVMSLAVKQDETITVTVEGTDEEKAADELKKYFEQNL
ncbi:HPr family phosphocarrier protein [Caproiciproducens galactitolivorans]|jgi:phosphocarrier protein HPr|uniref:Phosphocarrier protein HPr n=1 Tax=Caproiciproducens galactitolivorans TaxID=642589 RepID=A0A4Z0YDM5_9FIRM|nr:HPr family phosphocarrier protein [Caproiciproducens galactitolivorans]NLG92842.1 HPr family phosphocarrier protein [Clostridiales bacterium]QEY35789.1 HPr family phosphocarrier protein [Caproiciproducens galactitolivorans]TGJ77525.1 phosphocarrier protein HPr [Caproiciproducens galactitolivorans]